MHRNAKYNMNSINTNPILPKFDKTWTLFLDRDGVINERIPNDYVKTVKEFSFFVGVPLAMEKIESIFGHIFVVTNQQGIAKGLMTESDLAKVHRHMKKTIENLGGRIDKIYYCPEKNPSPCRKPNIGMAEQAKRDFPTIDFSRSVMVGDSVSDIEFGNRLGMFTVFIETKGESLPKHVEAQAHFSNLVAFINAIINN